MMGRLAKTFCLWFVLGREHGIIVGIQVAARANGEPKGPHMKTVVQEIPTIDDLDALPTHSDVIETIVMYCFRNVVQDAIQEFAKGRLTLKGALLSEGAYFVRDDALQLILSLVDEFANELIDQKRARLESIIKAVISHQPGKLSGLLTQNGLRVSVTYNGAGILRAKLVADEPNTR
ncbi:MAG: hypothetical protein WBP22_02715 [Candidatus Saccharimonas sp.]